MLLDKKKHNIHARLDLDVKPILESKNSRLPYKPPTLIRLDDRDINSGGTGVPEGSQGNLSLGS